MDLTVILPAGHRVNMSVARRHRRKNIRLKVNLPRNQLAVYRVPPRTLISEVLAMVCSDRAIEPDTHEIRHPVNIDEKLRGSCTLADYQLQEVSLVPRDYQAPPLSVTDLITMAAITSTSRETGDGKRRGLMSLFTRRAKSCALMSQCLKCPHVLMRPQCPLMSPESVPVS
ncbi:hypothetical protein O3P69_019101 [Scylla paramamosain]|uniref:Uncharacterized protein n=1 Tax=Scylla paramamosain TaxID=85552 RepID=A0AAW0SBL0_SCYPA